MANYRTILFIASTAIPALALAAAVSLSSGDGQTVIDKFLPPVSASGDQSPQDALAPDSADRTQPDEVSDNEDPDTRSGGFFASVSSDREIDPSGGKAFLLSVMVRIDQLPNSDARQKIVSKFNDTQPLVGWALAVRRYGQAIRPEFYYRGNDGKGGWYPFEQVQIDTSAWYNISLIINPGQWMVMFWEPARPGAENVLGDWQGGDRQAVIDAVLSERGIKTVTFLGGHELGNIAPPETAADLQFGAKRAKGIFDGEVAALLVAHLDGLPGNRGELRDLITGGAPGIERRLNPQAISLLVNRQGKDRSRFARPVSIVGG